MGGETRKNRWILRGLVVALGILLVLAAWATIVAIGTLALGSFDPRWTLTGPAWVAGDKMYEGLFNYPGWAGGAHFVTALVFLFLLPFQLSATLRNRYRFAHRIVGRIAVACGVVFAVTGIVLVYVLPARPFGERAFFTLAGLGYSFLLWRGVAAARRGDIPAHREWMLRVTALALAPTTWRVIFPIVVATAGIDSITRFWDLFVTTLWMAVAINIVVVEWWINRTRGQGRPAFAAGTRQG